MPPALFLVEKTAMINQIAGQKLETTQRFTKDGRRVPITRIKTDIGCVVQVKHEAKDGYQAVQIGWGERKPIGINKPLKGHLKGASLEKAPLYLMEVRLDKVADLKPGDQVKPSDILQPGDEVKVAGRSKGKGFTGVVKRWGFAGGPRTHGQSDRERAPGSIGQTTTPGRVFKGKKMAGRAGGTKTAILGLTVMEVDSENGLLLVKGLVPGPKKGWLVIEKVGEVKRFVPLMKVGEREIKETEEERAGRLRKEQETAEKLKEAEGEEKKEIGGVEKKEGKEEVENAAS